MAFDEPFGAVFLVTVIGLCSLIYFLNLRPRNFPPGPLSFPVVGNMLQLGPEPHRYFIRMRDKYGDIFSVNLGGFPTVVINGMDNIQEALLTMQNTFAGRPPFSAKLLFTQGIALADYRKDWLWKKKHIVRCLGNVMADKGFNLNTVLGLSQEDLIDVFAKHEGSPFDPYYAQHLSSFCVGLKFLFNKNTNLKQVEGKYDFKSIIDTVKGTISFLHVGNACNVLPWLWWIYPWGFTKALAFNKDFNTLTVENVNTLSDTHVPTNIRGIVDCFLATHCDEPDDREKLLLVVPELLIASFDTTATTLLWVYLFLVKNEKTQQKLQTSIDQVVGKTGVTMDDRKRLPLIESVILEVMRMEMPIPLGLPKMALEDCIFNGYNIPKGTVVITNFFSINCDPDLWDRPDDFIPERFIKDGGTLDREKERKELAFGTGQRRCPGEAIARAQLFMAVASVLQRFTLKKVEGENYNVTGVPGLTSSPPPFKILAEKR